MLYRCGMIVCILVISGCSGDNIIDPTLFELRQTYIKAFETFSHAHPFLKQTQIVSSLNNANFFDVKTRSETHIKYYDNFLDMINSLRQIGAKVQNSPGLTRSQFNHLASHHPITDKGLPLTYQVMYGSCQV